VDESLWILIDKLWQAEQRELQYLALDILSPLASKFSEGHVTKLEKMIITKSWWDTVDMIARNLIGKKLLKNQTC